MNSGSKTIFLIGVGLFVFMLASLFLMSQSLQDSHEFGKYYSVLLVSNSVGLICLVVLIGLNLKQLVQQLKNKVIGSRITLRMVMVFSVLAVTPVLIVYYFSLDFLNRGIDSWFDLRVEQALDDSLELSRLALDVRMRELLNITEQTAEDLSDAPNESVSLEIDKIRARVGADELMLLTQQGAVIASSTTDTSNLLPNRPDDFILLQLQQNSNYIGLDPVGNSGLFVRVVANIPKLGMEEESRLVQALFPVSERINKLASSVQSSFVKYKELSYLREKLKLSLILILTMVLLFSIFSAVWAGFYSAKKLSAPISHLAEGTRSIAEGVYNTKLPIPGNDELGFLIASFNEMTNKIRQARDNASKSQQEAEARKNHLETILSRLSSGVMVFDGAGIIEKSNISAGQILNVPLEHIIDQPLDVLGRHASGLDEFIHILQHNIAGKNQDWRAQITIHNISGDQILMVSGAVMPLVEHEQTGHVIVFDDITNLVKGQRDAAWSEIARRLAHEIKNPLTPIQLATERLRHKYLATMDRDSASTLDRLTKTIVHQVETMKGMVNNFSDYARSPGISLAPVAVNQLIQEAADLYDNLDQDMNITTRLDELPVINGDADRLRQVLNNLLKNALDANLISGSKSVEISSGNYSDHDGGGIEIKIKDSGPGIDRDKINELFDPYVTTKKKGTGLGLAIVKKTIEEHGGKVWLENNRDGTGTSAVIRLPAETVISAKARAVI